MAKLFVDFDMPQSQRNAMWRCLIHPEIREFYVDRDRIVRMGSPTCAPLGPRLRRTGR